MPDSALAATVLVTFVVAVLLSSLGEYLTHRLMHRSKVKAVVHREHHKQNSAQGVLGEAIDYWKGGVPIAVVVAVPIALLVSIAAAVAAVAGAVGYGLFAAYAHQLQHENPMRCWWLPMPIHYVHHKYNMWHHNFGIALDIWDRLFGTYRVEEWAGDAERARAERGPLAIKWV